MSSVVKMREGPIPTDIPGMLRQLADRIESGEVEARTMMLVWDGEDHSIGAACYGLMPERTHVVGLLTMAAGKAATGEWL